MALEDKPLPAVFIQYGVYVSRNKRERTSFHVLYHVSREELEQETKALLRRLKKKHIERVYADEPTNRRNNRVRVH